MVDPESSTYSYLLASAPGREAVIIDPVVEQTARYIERIEALALKLVVAIDTHTHADHISALGQLRDRLACTTMMGQFTKADCVSTRIADDELLAVDGIELRALYTPGHTDDSYSFVLDPRTPAAVFTGDCLLIESTGRTDLQGGNASASWRSIVEKLFSLPDETLVYPAHDYAQRRSSSIGRERLHNRRIAGRTEAEYVEIMRTLRLPYPKMMDIAVPANLACGRV